MKLAPVIVTLQPVYAVAGANDALVGRYVLRAPTSEAIELEEFRLVNQMANNDFKKALDRDTSLYDKVDTICRKYFDQSIKPENPMQKMLA
jgi:hypothetical protein